MKAPREMDRQIILDHHRRPRHFGVLPEANRVGAGHNPVCGDEVQVMLRVNGNVIEQAGFTAKGCAISVASASLMTSLMQGKTLAEARDLAAKFSTMMQTGEAPAELGESAALQGVHTLHTRVKCASLAWKTLESLLEKGTTQAEA